MVLLPEVGTDVGKKIKERKKLEKLMSIVFSMAISKTLLDLSF